MSLNYSIEVTPARALLGEPIAAMLRCSATTDLRGCLTFQHRSLVVALETASLAEPSVVFPNRHAIEAGRGLVRLASSGGVEDLAAGEERTRQLDLLPLFPALLNVGSFTISYRLEDAEPPVRPSVAVVEIVSGPEVVPLLIDQLAAEVSALRFLAGELLTKMTAQDFRYQADGPIAERQQAIVRWSVWWQQTGRLLPWNFQSDGATFARAPDPPPADLRSGHLGGIAYPGTST